MINNMIGTQTDSECAMTVASMVSTASWLVSNSTTPTKQLRLQAAARIVEILLYDEKAEWMSGATELDARYASIMEEIETELTVREALGE
jgi:hypothetical protein